MNRVSLSEIAAPRGLVGGPFGSALVNSDYALSGIPVIRGTNMGSGRFVAGEFVFVSHEKFERDLARNVAEPGDVVYTQRGTLGQVALVPADQYELYVVSQSQMRLRVDPDKACNRYVYYASIAPDFLRQIDDRAISTGVPHTNLGILSALEIPLPSRPQQQAIAEVLGALDDKIATNTAAMTAADGYLRAEYVAVTGAGEDLTLGDVAVFHNRRRVPLSAADRAERRGVVPYYGANGQMGTVDTPLFDEPIVLLGEDGSVCRPDGSPFVHYVWGPAWVNNHAHVLSGTKVSTELLSVMLRQSDVSALVTGAVQPKLSMGQARRLSLSVPAESQLASLEQLVGATFGSVRVLTEENRTLAATRDALLPHLMSGKLRVRDAEKIAGEVV